MVLVIFHGISLAIKRDIYDRWEGVDPLKAGLDFFLGSNSMIGGIMKGLMNELFEKVDLKINAN
jgi:hypothetical protein